MKGDYEILLVSPWTNPVRVNPGYQLIRNEINHYTRPLVKQKLSPFFNDNSNWDESFGDTVRYQDQYPYCPGLLSIAGYLEEKGYRVGCFSLDVEKERYNSPDWLTLFLKDNCGENTLAVGVTAVTPEYNRAISFLEAVKKHKPNCHTVIGGTHVTYCDQETAQNQAVDFVVRGEGEVVLHELLEGIANNNGFETVKGITYRKGSEIVKNPDAPIVQLESLPIPAYHLLDKFTLDRVHLTPTYTRGCPFKCSYCVESVFFQRKVRSKNPDQFVQELKQILALTNVKIIHIADSTFGINKETTLALCEALEKNKLDVVFSVNLRPDVIRYMGEELLEKLVKLNFLEFYIGMESSNDELLESLNRKQNHDEFINALEVLKKLGVPLVKAYLIIGVPGDTYSSVQHTLDRVRDLLEKGLIFYATGKFFVPVPGTEQFESGDGFKPINKEWEKYERYSFPPLTEITTLSRMEVEHYLCLLQALQLAHYRKIVGADEHEQLRIDTWADNYYMQQIYL